MPPPAESVLRWGALAKDRSSIVKITGVATSCFALTASAVQADVHAGAHATTNVSTQGCVG